MKIFMFEKSVCEAFYIAALTINEATNYAATILGKSEQDVEQVYTIVEIPQRLWNQIRPLTLRDMLVDISVLPELIVSVG